jgi:ADP-heptose:LPS heptosyltransferase
MHGSGQISNPFVLSLNGKVTAGYYEGTAPAGLTIAAPYPRDQHEIYRNLGLAASLGCTALDPTLEFPLFDEDHTEATTLLRLLPQANRPWIGIHAGARPPARRWQASHFAHLADELVRRFDAQILLTGSSFEEEAIQAVASQMQTKPINLVGQTSLGGLAALISKLDLFISNDTGPGHMACAVNTPSITLFGPADYVRWAPLDTMQHRAVRHPVACSPCGYWECPIDHRCLRWLSPETVLDVAQDLIKEVSGPHKGGRHVRRAA